MEVPDEDHTEEGKVCGCLVKAMYGSRQAASAWQEEAEKGDARSKHASRGVVTHRSNVDGSDLVHGDDFVIVTRW